jgi:hypothetical protein
MSKPTSIWLPLFRCQVRQGTAMTVPAGEPAACMRRRAEAEQKGLGEIPIDLS